MRNTFFNKLFGSDRKVMYIILSVLVLSAFTLSIAYAALSTTLNINGNAEVNASSWDIYLDNVVLNDQSATNNIPTIVNKTTVTFTTTLNMPGDYFEFTVDVVNNGSIDAMVDSITKTPELTASQAKYLKYIVEYQNGESIATKQLVSKKSFVRLKVRLEYRNDISATDIPATSETLTFTFKVNYLQSDNTGSNVVDNGVDTRVLKIVSGDLDTVGSEIAVGNEHFYIVSEDDTSITMLSKYNLYVGYGCTDLSASSCTLYGNEATGIQDATMRGYLTYVGSGYPKGTTEFSTTNYWSSTVSSYPAYIYNSNSTLYNYVENYKNYLIGLGANVLEARLMKLEEFEPLGCSIDNRTCSSSQYSWIYSTSYWTGSVFNSSIVWIITSNGNLNGNNYAFYDDYGVRPVIKLLKADF